MKFEGLLSWKGFKNHNCNPFKSSSLYILDFSNICYVVIISFDVLSTSGYVIKLDCSFRVLNFDKFCDTAPLQTGFTKKSFRVFLLALLLITFHFSTGRRKPVKSIHNE